MSRFLYEYDKNLNFIKQWDYCLAACKHYNITKGYLSTCANYNTKCKDGNYKYIVKLDYKIFSLKKLH